MEALFLHLTDIHINGESDFDIICGRNQSLCNAFFVHVTNEKNTILFICLTGDITYSGTEEQFLYAELWLNDLIEKIRRRYPDILIQVVAVPGNHDCNFNNKFSSTRELLLKNIEVSSAIKPEIMDSYTKIQEEYFQFVKKYNDNNMAFGCDKNKILTVNEYAIENEPYVFKFHCINTAWCSSIHERKGDIHFIADKNYVKSKNDIVVTLVHHDESWLGWNDAENWKKYYKEYSDIVFVGHDHVAEYVHKENYDRASNYFIKGNQLYDLKTPDQSGFNILKVDLTTNIQSFITYEWNGGIYTEIINTKGIPFIKNRFYTSGNRLKDSMNEFLESLNIDISFRDKNPVSLTDIYVFPTLIGKDTTLKRKNVHYRTKDEIISIINDKKYVVINGQKEAGKTALLKELFKYYIDINKIPVWIDVSKIESSDVEKLNEIVKSLYGEQYDGINAEAILQLEPESKVCIIDDYDDLSISDDSTKKLIQYFVNRFDVVLIARTPSKSIVNSFRNLESNKAIEEQFYKLEICEVMSYWRRKLITKWMMHEYSYQDDSSLEFDTKRKELDSQINNVMKNGFFRRTPLELLLVLSYLDNSTRINMDYSRYSYIYDCLLKDKLNDISQGKTDDAAMYQTILEQLAYRMYKSGNWSCVEESFLSSVIYDYNQEYTGAKGAAFEIINQFIKYNILIKTKDNKYKFKYDYMLYYFNCSYIEHQMSHEERCNVIEELIDDITVDINYNTVLFLAFRANAEYDILPSVKKCENRLLVEFENHKYEDHFRIIDELEKSINEKVERIFTVPFNKNITQLQDRASIISDRISEEIGNEETESQAIEMGRELKEILQLYRLAELLSEIIKNYAGKIKREPRIEIINEIYIITMKTFGKMLSSLDSIHGKILKLTEEEQVEKSSSPLIKTGFIKSLRNYLYRLLTAFTKANVYLMATWFDNDRITKEILDFNNELNSDFFKMVSVEFLINTGRGRLPTSEIKKYFKSKEKIGVFSQHVLREIIQENLYSFQFEAHDKQTVCDLLNFDIKNYVVDWNNDMEIIEETT